MTPNTDDKLQPDTQTGELEACPDCAAAEKEAWRQFSDSRNSGTAYLKCDKHRAAVATPPVDAEKRWDVTHSQNPAAFCLVCNEHPCKLIAATPSLPSAPTDAGPLRRAICNVVHKHCEGIQLPHGINGLENDLVAALHVSGATPSTPLCVVHAALDKKDELELEVCNDCVACSLNQRSELLGILEPYAPTGASWDPAVILQRSLTRLPSAVAPTECFCGTELEAGICPNGHDPITLPMPSTEESVAWAEEAMAITDVLRELSQKFNRIDNGHCTICRQFRLYDTHGKMGRCENSECLSHKIATILENYEKPSAETLERMKQRCLERITTTPLAAPEGEQDLKTVDRASY